MAFDLRDLTPYQGKSTAIKRPREIAFFSFDDKHICHTSSSASLQHYYPPFFSPPHVPPNHSFNLGRGFEAFIKRDDTFDEHLDSLLETLVEYEVAENVKVDAEFITWRGMMTKILTAPYDDMGGWGMYATYFEGTIYIQENIAVKHVSNALDVMRADKGRQKLAEFWGYKFETLSTLPRPWAECSRDQIESRDLADVNSNIQYCSIARTEIGGHKLVIGGEVDAIERSKPNDPEAQIPYVELKTNLAFHEKDVRNTRIFHEKLCKTWAQSFLLGVPKVVVGFRSRNGQLLHLEEFETMRIPGFVKNAGYAPWDGNVCINFAASFLSFLKETITGKGTWQIEKNEKSNVITVRKTSDEYPHGILNRKFKEHREVFVPKPKPEAAKPDIEVPSTDTEIAKMKTEAAKPEPEAAKQETGAAKTETGDAKLETEDGDTEIEDTKMEIEDAELGTEAANPEAEAPNAEMTLAV